MGCCGLQLYRFGETISIPYFTTSWRPDSFYDKLLANRAAGLHTLALLDIKVREPTLPSLARAAAAQEASTRSIATQLDRISAADADAPRARAAAMRLGAMEGSGVAIKQVLPEVLARPGRGFGCADGRSGA